MMNKNIIKKMKINSLFVLCIFVISLFAVPAQAISSYVEDCHWRKATMWGTDVMEVTVHNPSGSPHGL
ncbi:MAG: hypothetical protein QMD80_06370 [archaeon]|nr:hypothetical protein [archaeon]